MQLGALVSSVSIFSVTNLVTRCLFFNLTFRLSLSLIFNLFFCSISFANSKVDLLVWQSSSDSPKVVLPLINDETPTSAVHRYVSLVYQDADLKKLLKSVELSETIFSAYKLPIPSQTTKPRLLFIANLFEDITSFGERIQRNIKRFSNAGADTFVVGLSADIGLSDQAAIQFRSQIAIAFNLLVALGGDDISEELSGRTRHDDSKTIFRRDISELELIKAFKKFGKGLFFGICRGHQIGAIADGHTVISDLTNDGIGNTHDHLNIEGQNTTDKQTWHHIYVEKGSLLARMSGIKTDQSGLVLKVNSIHHQAVSTSNHDHSHPVAHHETSGVEALQMRNGLGLSVQFHPEFPPEVSNNPEFSNLGFKLIKNIVAYARLIRSRFQMDAQVNSCNLYVR